LAFLQYPRPWALLSEAGHSVFRHCGVAPRCHESAVCCYGRAPQCHIPRRNEPSTPISGLQQRFINPWEGPNGGRYFRLPRTRDFQRTALVPLLHRGRTLLRGNRHRPTLPVSPSGLRFHCAHRLSSAAHQRLCQALFSAGWPTLQKLAGHTATPVMNLVTDDSCGFVRDLQTCTDS